MTEIFTVGEIARHLKVTPRTVRTWLRDGYLKGVRLAGKHGHWMVTVSELEKQLKVGMVDSGKTETGQGQTQA